MRGKEVADMKRPSATAVCSSLLVLACCATGNVTTESLIGSLREDPYAWGNDRCGRALVSRGPEASPLLLREFETADGYYLYALANVLGQIPSGERDEAFLRKLEQKQSAVDDFLLPTYAAAMMQALAKSRCAKAVPVIRQYATDKRLFNELRTHAKVALSVLGEEFQKEAGTASPVIVIPEVEKASKQPFAQEALGLLRALVDNDVFEGDGEISVTVIEPDGNNKIHLGGRLPGKGGRWTAGFQRAGRDKYKCKYSWYTGPKAAAWYRGVLLRKHAQWQLTSWHCYRRS